MHGLRLALSTLTVFRCPVSATEDMGRSLYWFPLVGAMLGTSFYIFIRVLESFSYYNWSSGFALLTVILEAWMTRGFHMDGLADWADSIGGMGKDRRLEIMKDTSLGVFGVIALFITLSVRWTSIERMIDASTIIWLIPAMSIPRAMMVELCTTVPYARQGLGTGRAFVETASFRHRLASLLLCLFICVPFGPLCIGSLLLGFFVTRLFAARCMHHFGGVTGDLIGMSNEMITMLILVVYAFMGSKLTSMTGWSWLISLLT